MMALLLIAAPPTSGPGFPINSTGMINAPAGRRETKQRCCGGVRVVGNQENLLTFSLALSID